MLFLEFVSNRILISSQDAVPSSYSPCLWCNRSLVDGLSAIPAHHRYFFLSVAAERLFACPSRVCRASCPFLFSPFLFVKPSFSSLVFVFPSFAFSRRSSWFVCSPLNLFSPLFSWCLLWFPLDPSSPCRTLAVGCLLLSLNGFLYCLSYAGISLFSGAFEENILRTRFSVGLAPFDGVGETSACPFLFFPLSARSFFFDSSFVFMRGPSRLQVNMSRQFAFNFFLPRRSSGSVLYFADSFLFFFVSTHRF